MLKRYNKVILSYLVVLIFKLVFGPKKLLRRAFEKPAPEPVKFTTGKLPWTSSPSQSAVNLE